MNASFVPFSWSTSNLPSFIWLQFLIICKTDTLFMVYVIHLYIYIYILIIFIYLHPRLHENKISPISTSNQIMQRTSMEAYLCN
jgi:hypothetical protein